MKVTMPSCLCLLPDDDLDVMLDNDSEIFPESDPIYVHTVDK